MESTQFKGRGVIKWALSAGIVIVLNLFFAVAIQTVYPEPKYENFCPQPQVNRVYEDEASCLADGGQWNQNIPLAKGDAAGYCNVQFTCSQDFEDSRKTYAQNVFVALVVLGALAIGIGFALRISPAVSAGLSYGGVLSFIIASVRYWGEAGDLIRLAIVALALVALIVIGVKKFKE